MTHTPAPGTPYASSWQPPAPRIACEPEDHAMVGIAMLGAGLALFTFLPAGIITGPLALTRARRVEERMARGTRPASDRAAVVATRIAAWISLIISIPVTLLLLVLVAAAMG
ncbi:MAG: hypothetical protein IT463_02560 [Planctomycetes bacterium]|nr:hypothetical protein [Planctomycetota bacterium]